MDTATKPAPVEVKKEAPRARRYLMRANANAGKNPELGGTGPGAFNGVCMVYEGDEFYLTIPTVRLRPKDKDGNRIFSDARSAELERDGQIPSWCDPIAEYPLDSTPQPLRTF